MPFTELLDALQSGKIDMIISAMTITPNRNTKVMFIGQLLYFRSVCDDNQDDGNVS